MNPPIATATLSAWEPHVTVHGVRHAGRGWRVTATDKRTKRRAVAQHKNLATAAGRAVALLKAVAQ